MKFSKTLKIITVTVIFLFFILFIIYRNIDVGITEYYSQYWVSHSIDESQKKGVFVNEYRAIPDVINFNQHKIVFDEIWVENISRLKYKYTFLEERQLLNRYRLVITLKNNISTDSVYIPFVFGKKRNGFTLSSSFNKEIFYEEITSKEMAQDSLFISLIERLSDKRNNQIKLIKHN